MPSPLALLADFGHELKAALPAAPARLSFGSNGIRRETVPVFWPDGLAQNFSGGGAAATYDYNALLSDPLQNSVVAACVDAITRAYAEAPLMLEQWREKTDRGTKVANWERVEHHEALDLFAANPHLSQTEIWGLKAAHAATKGESYWVIFMNQAGTKPAEIWPWKPEQVRAERDAEKFISGYWIKSDEGKETWFPSERVIHFRHLPNPNDYYCSWNPLRAGQVHMVGDNTATQYSTALLLNAGVMSQLMTVKRGDAQSPAIDITPAQFDAALDALRRKYIGNKAAVGGIDGFMLPLEITNMAFSPDKMGIPELSQGFMQRIHALIGVSPMVTDLGKDPTYLNKWEAINDFWERRIVPDKNKDADTLNRQLLPLLGLDPREWRFAFDFSRVAALQENADQLFTRWTGVYNAGGCDLYTYQTKIGESDVPDDYKGRFVKPLLMALEGAAESAAAALGAEVKKWDESQHPRADDGKFGNGAHEGNTGKVIKENGIVRKSAILRNGKESNEGKVYAALSGVEGVAKGKQVGGEIHLEEYRNVIGVDDVPEKNRASLRGIVGRNEARINRAVSELSSRGIAYNDQMQFGLAKENKMDLLDFSNASFHSQGDALEKNVDDLQVFYKTFGATAQADHVRDVYETFQGAKDPDYRAFGTDEEQAEAEKLHRAFEDSRPRAAYYATNAREIGIKGAVSTEKRDGRKIVISSNPLPQSEIDKWELTPVIELHDRPMLKN